MLVARVPSLSVYEPQVEQVLEQLLRRAKLWDCVVCVSPEGELG